MKAKYIIIAIVLLVIANVANCQRGGGGGSRGGGGGGSRGFSSGRSSYGSSSSCQRRCGPDAVCLQNCSSGTGTAVGIIMASVFGGLCLGGFSILAVFKCCIRKWCCCHKFQSLKREYNKVDAHSMTLQQYSNHKNYIVSLLKSSQQINNFGFNQRDKKFTIRTNRVQVKDTSPFISELKIFACDEGPDNLGSWSGEGYILCRDGHIFMWFYKEYENKSNAGQTDKWEHLIYQSTNYDTQHGLDGRWFYSGFEDSDLYSGRWYLCENNNISY